VAAALLLVAGCKDDKASVAKPELIRSVKVQAVSSHADAQRRSLAGEVKPADSSALSFQVQGRVAAVLVREGERVTEGQELARIDPAPYRLNVQSAEAALANARTVMAEKAAKLQGQKELDAKGFTSRNNVRSAEAEAATARSNVRSAEGRLALAQRDLAGTVITAPVSGVISSRTVEPFEDVAAGQVLMRLDSIDKLLVEVRVPEGLIDRIKAGDPVNVRVNRHTFAGKIGQIGAQVEVGNAYYMTVRLPAEAKGLRRGMSAEVSLALQAREGSAPHGLLIPTTALLAGDEPMSGYIFAFDPQQSVVQRRPVKIKDLQGNNLEIDGDLTPGTLIVVAGVAFLSDGQKVKLFNPDALETAKLLSGAQAAK
jgi:RND family efflux transporter MFP subunit